MAASCIQFPLPKSSHSSAVTMEGGVASVGLKFWKPSFTFGGQKSLTAVTHLANQYGRKYFMSHSKHSISAQPLLTLTISEEKLDIMLIFIPL